MADYFLDASALVKYYFEEPGSDWVGQLIDDWDEAKGAAVNKIHVGNVSVVEVPAAIAILHRNRHLSQRGRDKAVSAFLYDFSSIYKVSRFTSDVLLQAVRLTQQYPLKAYDAVQLAIGLAVNEVCQSQAVQLTFVSSDRQLLAAARAEGLLVEDPHDHL